MKAKIKMNERLWDDMVDMIQAALDFMLDSILDSIVVTSDVIIALWAWAFEKKAIDS